MFFLNLSSRVDQLYGTNLAGVKIVASNDINEAVLTSLNDQRHEINVFGIGTNLVRPCPLLTLSACARVYHLVLFLQVTCQAQPALGMVYKLVEINGIPRIKLSQDLPKVCLCPCEVEGRRL